MDRVFIERGVPGSVAVADRPEGATLLSLAQSGNIIIATKLDRMFRSADDALATTRALKTRGIQLHLIELGGDVTGGGIAKLVFTVLAGVAEMVREQIAERVATVKADQRQRGRYLGGRVPFGFTVDDDGALIAHAPQQAAIAHAKAMRATGSTLDTTPSAPRSPTMAIRCRWARCMAC